MIHAAQFPDVKWAEKRLHQVLSSKNVRAKGGTEFFFLSSRDAVEIVNALAYQVSVFEAKRALDENLERFVDKISNKFPLKIAVLFALVTFGGAITLFARGVSPHSLGDYLIFAFEATGPALFGGIIGVVVGQFVAKIIWKESIALEREHLLEKYPAARQDDK
jgi:hypothetical protein